MAFFEEENEQKDFDERHELLSHDETPLEKCRHRQSLRPIVKALAAIVSCAILTALSVAAALSIFPRQQVALDINVQKSPCGSSPAEARALGCTFDMVSFAWLAPACYDPELSNTFDQLGEWEWFIDPARTRQIPKAEALTGEYPILYVNWEYHIVHCTYMWKKMHRAIVGAGKAAIDGYIGDYEHTEHCSMMLLSGRDLDLNFINTGLRVKYPDCGLA